MNYDVMDLDAVYWRVMMFSFCEYDILCDFSNTQSKDFCKMYCGV